YAVIGIIAISVLLSIIHGFVRELLALASWVVAFLVAQTYASDITVYMPAALPTPAARLLAAFLLIFIATLLVMTLLAVLLSTLLRKAGLGFADRAMGAVFGLVRGVAIVMIVVLLAGLTSLPKQPVWRNAALSAPLVVAAKIVKQWLPNDLARHISYD